MHFSLNSILPTALTVGAVCSLICYFCGVFIGFVIFCLHIFSSLFSLFSIFACLFSRFYFSILNFCLFLVLAVQFFSFLLFFSPFQTFLDRFNLSLAHLKSLYFYIKYRDNRVIFGIGTHLHYVISLM